MRIVQPFDRWEFFLALFDFDAFRCSPFLHRLKKNLPAPLVISGTSHKFKNHFVGLIDLDSGYIDIHYMHIQSTFSICTVGKVLYKMAHDQQY